MEDSDVESSVNFSVLNHRMKDWEIIAIPITAIIIAELLLYMGKLQAGISLHVLIPLGLAASSMWMRESNLSFALETLAMLPILRLVNISMPVFTPMTLYLFIYIYTPLLIPIFIVIRHQKITLEELGVKFDKLHLYIPVAMIAGYVIAIAEYNTITVHSLIPDASAENLFKIAVIMLFFVGLVEEIIFRSLLQNRLQTSFGMTRGLLVTGILFGIMHSGYGTLYEIAVTGIAGIVIGYMFQKTGSLPLIALTHGFVNICLFGLIPLMGYGLGLV
ncbi:MAG: CPBP family intramembrane metalloprotease [Methanomethylovorans sp.]|jgi:hypothetical protein|nr:CPBP family intramembrane metalloprotease [Methanomethylovorans sp.]